MEEALASLPAFPTVAWAAGALALLGIAYLWRLNRIMFSTPPEALLYSPRRWTAEECRAAYARVDKNPISWKGVLPPKLDRRYIVVGGSGLVGGNIVFLLLEQGHHPSSIRIVDSRVPSRDGMLSGPASRVGFVRADIASLSSVEAAFLSPWDDGAVPGLSSLPLTVFHTAAVIRPSERNPLVYDRCARVNVAGTANCISAARGAGATVFVSTGSSSVAVRPVRWFGNPFRAWPRDFFQLMREDDFFQPIRGHGEFFSNYARSKAEAERIVCGANELGPAPASADAPSPGGDGGGKRGRGERRGAEPFRAGVIRPGSAVYGHVDDLVVGKALRLGAFPTFTAPWLQNWVHASNAAAAHLQHEAALLGPYGARVAGRPFLVSDPGPGLLFRDFYKFAAATADRPFKVYYPPPLLILALAYLVEWYCALLYRAPPFLRGLLREPTGDLGFMQPAVFDCSTNMFVDDSDAKRSPEDGGIGYRGACGTMEGLCMQLREWNRITSAEEVKGKEQPREKIRVGADPVATRA